MTPPPGPEGHDGFCFTAGVKGAVMGVGTIHACLASRRPPPQVVAGISLGALNAAALQRVYRDIAAATGRPDAEQDAARWAWFREYLETVADQPFKVLWNAVPDQSDFFADMIPIRDASVPEEFHDAETTARRHLYLKVKLGRWLARLPVTVRLVASALVNYVRAREHYPLTQRALSGIRLLANGLWLGVQLVRRVAVAPQFFPEHEFAAGHTWTWWFPKLCGYTVGWLNLLSATTAVLFLAGLLVHLIALGPPASRSAAWAAWWPLLVGIAAVPTLVRVTRRFRQRVWNSRAARILLGLPLGLAAYAYSAINVLCLALATLFGASILQRRAQSETLGQDDVSLLLGVLILDGVLSVLFAAVALLPVARDRLVALGLLRKWPRPLFGWGPFLASWTNLVALTSTAGLGLFFIFFAPKRSGLSEVFVVEALTLLAALPIAPLLVFVPTALMWGRLKRIANARRGARRVFAWAVAVGLLGGSFYLSTVLFSVPQNALRGLLRTNLASPLETYAYGWHLLVLSAFALMVTWFATIAVITQPPLRRWFGERVLDHVGLKQSLLPDFHLTLMLSRLFDPQHGTRGARAGTPDPLPPPPKVDGGDGYPAAVIVAAPLQTLYEGGVPRPADQLWAGRGTTIQEALRGALSVPPLFTPLRLKPGEFNRWLKREIASDARTLERCRRGIDLVDGSVIRQNPLPALFSFLRRYLDLAIRMTGASSRERPAIHVVYGVPIVPRPAGSQAFVNTIVDVGLGSLRLSQRRDTQLEVMQTRVIARLEGLTSSRDPGSPSHALYADEIAPDHDESFQFGLNPDRAAILKGAATGCRRTIETLYAPELAAHRGRAAANAGIDCGVFLHALGRHADPSARPGLPEVCGSCSGTLKRPAPPATERSTASVETHLSKPELLCQEHPQLAGDRPRIVFVASGGVFRGAFHIGMLAALRLVNAKPDLIVGASVGTLMGAALGRMFAQPEAGTLSMLVNLFLEVDNRVALTRTLKNAARELGLRGRSIGLSPGRVRRLVRRGGRGDAGFAVTGAPSALIDAISDLFLIPLDKTQKIAAQFVAGHPADAVDRFITQLRTETIGRLDIERAVIGTSLLEQVAAELLTGGDAAMRRQYQPFQESAGIGFYGTATNLLTESAVLLGSRGHAPRPDAPFDFVEAALASSAFPVVFAPRPESLVYPGSGTPDVLFADGGMFDNLPFLPAIEILSQGQLGYRPPDDAPQTRLQRLQARVRQPDLLIAGALDPRPEVDEEAGSTYDSIESVRRRAGSLKNNVKIRSFEKASRRIYGQLLRLETARPEWIESPDAAFLDKVVNAGVLPVFPRSREHLNGTFSFCASTGLARRRVQKSIADGCFQTLRALARQQAEGRSATDLDTSKDRLATRSIDALTKAGRLAGIETSSRPSSGRPTCPYFQMGGLPFDCPFAPPNPTRDRRLTQMLGVYHACSRDAAHRRPQDA